MVQGKIWEKEYKNPILVTGNKPQKFFLRFLKYLKKSDVNISKLKVLDLGSGTGKIANYLASLGASVAGIEISSSAIKIARENAKKLNVNVKYMKGNIGDKYSFKENYFDLIIDATSSNSLNEPERKIYLSESNRVMRSGAYFFVRTLRKNGDKNAKYLLKNNPGKEYDTYIMENLGLEERVFSDEDFKKMYSAYFKIEKVINESGYTRISDKQYKRNFRVAYLRKK